MTATPTRPALIGLIDFVALNLQHERHERRHSNYYKLHTRTTISSAADYCLRTAAQVCTAGKAIALQIESTSLPARKGSAQL
jgi:hypothetical protein